MFPWGNIFTRKYVPGGTCEVQIYWSLQKLQLDERSSFLLGSDLCILLAQKMSNRNKVHSGMVVKHFPTSKHPTRSFTQILSFLLLFISSECLLISACNCTHPTPKNVTFPVNTNVTLADSKALGSHDNPENVKVTVEGLWWTNIPPTLSTCDVKTNESKKCQCYKDVKQNLTLDHCQLEISAYKITGKGLVFNATMTFGLAKGNPHWIRFVYHFCDKDKKIEQTCTEFAISYSGEYRFHLSEERRDLQTVFIEIVEWLISAIFPSWKHSCVTQPLLTPCSIFKPTKSQLPLQVRPKQPKILYRLGHWPSAILCRWYCVSCAISEDIYQTEPNASLVSS